MNLWLKVGHCTGIKKIPDLFLEYFQEITSELTDESLAVLLNDSHFHLSSKNTKHLSSINVDLVFFFCFILMETHCLCSGLLTRPNQWIKNVTMSSNMTFSEIKLD